MPLTPARLPPSRSDDLPAFPNSSTVARLDPLTGVCDHPYADGAHGVPIGAARRPTPRPVARSQLTPKVSPRTGARMGALLTVEEVGERLRLSRTSVYRLVERRQLPFFRLPGSLRFSEEDIATFLAARRVETIDRQHL